MFAMVGRQLCCAIAGHDCNMQDGGWSAPAAAKARSGASKAHVGTHTNQRHFREAAANGRFSCAGRIRLLHGTLLGKASMCDISQPLFSARGSTSWSQKPLTSQTTTPVSTQMQGALHHSLRATSVARSHLNHKSVTGFVCAQITVRCGVHARNLLRTG
jgi:hypothetical protein